MALLGTEKRSLNLQVSLPSHMSRDSSAVLALNYELDDRNFEIRRGLGMFLFTTVSRQALGPTQTPIQWLPGALSLGVKRSGREADHSIHLMPR